MCVLGKQGFVGCDCLIPRGLSFHSSSCLIPHHGSVVSAVASLGSGTPAGARTVSVLEDVSHLLSAVTLAALTLMIY